MFFWVLSLLAVFAFVCNLCSSLIPQGADVSDQCKLVGCPDGCEGESGICCGQNVTLDTGEAVVWCNPQCLPRGYVCCGCNPRYSLDPTLACIGCPSEDGVKEQVCLPLSDHGEPSLYKLDWACTSGAAQNLPPLFVAFLLLLATLWN